MEEIRAKFAALKDTRHQSYVEHPLADVLIIVMCAVMCGLDELGDIALFAQNRKDVLRDRLGIGRVPSKATLSRVLAMVDGAAVGAAVVEIMRERAGQSGHVVAVDGKAIRSTSGNGCPRPALQILTAYVTESGVVLGHRDIREKTNEIPVFQEMLGFLDIAGKTVTADALHCQRETCRKIIEKQGDYVLGLKGNQQALFNDVALFLDGAGGGVECHTTVEKNAGRIETRACRKIKDLAWLADRGKWPGLRSVFSIRRTVEARGRRTDETSHYISSLDAAPGRLMQIAREHWKVESLHWLLDVTFSEDACRLLSENGHKTLNAFRKLALLAHKRHIAATSPKPTLKAHLLSALLNEQLMMDVIRNL